LSAIEQLIAGHLRFRDGYYEENSERLIELARLGQSPKVAVVACCDSRVDPAIITDSTPGDLFVIRNVANLVPPSEGKGVWHGTSSALQFAVCNLEVEHVIVLGHARCGGIRSLLEGKANKHEDRYITAWMSIADEARKRVLSRSDLQTFEERAHACELQAIEISLANLETFPWIQQRIEQNKLQIHGWYYDMMSGDILYYDSTEKGFMPLDQPSTQNDHSAKT